LPDGSLLVGGKMRTRQVRLRRSQQAKEIRSVRIEALAHSSMVKGGPGRAANGNFALSDVKLTAAALSGGKAVAGQARQAAGDVLSSAACRSAATVDADARSAWAIDPQFGKDHAAGLRTGRADQ